MINWLKFQWESYKSTKYIPYIFSVWIPFHTVAVIGLLYSLINWNWVYVLYFIFGWIIFGGIGAAIMLHRYFSHNFKSLKLYETLKIPLFWIACLTGQGSPIWWAALHRGIHHPYSDTQKDIHTPIKGFWYSYMGWMFSINYSSVNLKYGIDLYKNKTILWFHKNYNKVIWCSIILMAFFISPMFVLWFYIMPALVALHTDAAVNSFGHSNFIGYRNFQTNDNSRNISLLGYLGWGQGWHNNHHQSPKSFDFGTSISKKIYEFDMCLLLLPFICPVKEVTRIWKGWWAACRGQELQQQ